MSPISANIVKHHQLPTIFHYLSHLFGWILILRPPKILRMEAQTVSQDSLKLLARLHAEMRVRHYSIRTEETYVGSNQRGQAIALVITIPIPLPFILHRRWRFVIILLRPATWLGLPLLSSHGFDLCIEA